MSDDTSTFGGRLHFLMRRRGWTQKQLAEHAQLSESAVSRHLTRQGPPKFSCIQKYCAVFGVNAEWLSTGHGGMIAAPTAAPTTSESLARPRPPLGRDALEAVLHSYPWPSGTDPAQMDAICAIMRAEANKPPGALRPESVWRELIAQALQRKSSAAQLRVRTRR